jgi:Glutamine amidotransferase domain
MCGIVGLVSSYSNGFTHKEASVFSDLLFLDTVRGFDSTGVFGVTNDGNVSIHKEASHGLDFLRTKEYKAFNSDMVTEGKIMVGHNRAATRGTIIDKNAHPFWVDDKIVLVQNGTYKGSHSHLKDTAVDTEAIAHTIADSPSIEEALQKINASYALVWYNAETEELNLIRNSERPLWLAEYYTSGIAFASEANMLRYAFERNDVKLKKEPVELPAHTLVTFKLAKGGTYCRTDTKLDAGYRFLQSSVVETETTHYGHLTHYSGRPNSVVQTLPRVSSQNAMNDIRYTFVDQINRDKKEYWFPTQQAAAKAMDDVKESINQGKHFVEMVDYFPANDHPLCQTWHVFGTVVGQNIDTTGPAFLVHWIQYGKSEEEIMAMVLDTFYKCTLSTNVLRSVHTNTKSGYLVTAYATTSEVVEGVAV